MEDDDDLTQEFRSKQTADIVNENVGIHQEERGLFTDKRGFAFLCVAKENTTLLLVHQSEQREVAALF